ncbi:MAG: O-antigen ligase family protein [Lachnospiraceae bacterium]|nr:O-antigen ligase family protein [Lachnospiraceae bacterium]
MKQYNNFFNDFNKKYIGRYIINSVNYIYLFLILCVFPLVFHNYYFDITKTRSDFFLRITIGYIILILIAYGFEIFWSNSNKSKSLFIVEKKDNPWLYPELWMTFFLMSNFFAYLITLTDDGMINGNSAFTGSDGRLMGLSMYLVIGLMFLLLCRYVDIKLPVYVLFGFMTLFAYLVSIVQHVDPDTKRFSKIGFKPKGLLEGFLYYVFKLKDGISKKQYNIFISTFGNINIFASFIVISLAVFACMFIFSNKLFYRIFAGIVVVTGGTVMMIANSDSAYIGVGAVMIFLFILAFKDDVIARFFQTLILLGLGNFFIVLINKYMSEVLKKKYDKRGGFAEHLDRVDYAVLILIILVVLYSIVFFVNRKYKDKLEKINKNKAVIIFMAVIFVAGIFIVYIGNKKHIGAFTFNYRWGTFRGYIWTKCVKLFKDAPLMNKLFGYGNESLKTLMNTYYHDEMVSVTNKIYDNAHNEILQYLVTTGLCGVISYVGLFIASFIYIFKNSKKNVVAYISLTVMLGYFVQGLMNLNQPITTPFYFVFMAVGVGCVRALMRKDM